ncbi:MAG TPA: cytochrome C oxidase subunit IV family protein [Usitatibacter sp.]|nr:cytochrome C oxidase subunit IV family protein [Usitatibacter sp.]
MNSPPPPRVYWLTWLALLLLLAATFAIAHLGLGVLNPAASLAIAAAKVTLVALFFMHLRRGSALVVLFALVGLFGLAILFALSGADYATRATNPAPWTQPHGH